MTTKETVKISPELLVRVNKLIGKLSKKYKYESAKQFVNHAVVKLLEEEEAK